MINARYDHDSNRGAFRDSGNAALSSQKTDAAIHFIFKTLSRCHSRAHCVLIKEYVLNDLCGMTLGILSFFLPQRKGNIYLM